MRKFKTGFSSKLKPAKVDHEHKQPCSIEPAIPLKRSNAKLQKAGRSSSVVNLPSFEAELQQALDLPGDQQPRPNRVDSGVSSAASQDPVKMIRVPYGMYGWIEVPAQSNKTKTTKTGAGSNLADPPAERHSIFKAWKNQQVDPVFGAWKKKQSDRPADNFTMWMNNKPGKKPASNSASVSYHTAKESQEMVAAEQSTRKSEAGDDPYEDAASARDSWAARLDVVKKYKGKGKQRALEIPSQRTRSHSLSPVDSGVVMMDEAVVRPRPIPRPLSGAPGPSLTCNDIQEEMNRVHSEEAALLELIKRTQQEWDDRIHAIELHKEELLERQQQEEEDRRQALKMAAEEERIAAEQAAEEERLAAELAAEEERIAAALAAEEERIAAELAKQRECVCCGDSKDPLDFYARSATENCTHPNATCIECMESWLASEFDTKGTESIKCPECPSTLTYPDMQLLASEKTFESYEKLLTRNALSSLPEFSWCLSPTCSSGQLNTSNANFMDCISCHYKACLTHLVPWHTDETCSEYDHRVSGAKSREEIAATEAMLDSISKLCPNKECGWRIQKIDGCDHMTCRRCRWEFCWECGASHRKIKSEGNTAHEEKCKFHSKNLDVAWPFNAHA